MVNQDIKNAVAGRGLKLWQIADELGIADSALSKRLRYELKPEDRTRIEAAIERLCRKRGDDC